MDLQQLGEDSLKQFIETLYKQLVIEKKRFDLIVGAGNSGQIMVWISKTIYDFLKIPLLPTFVFPLYRYKNFPKKILFDNSKVIEDYAHIHIPTDARNVLFVDDEIERGNAAEATLKVLTVLGSDPKHFIYTIIAEDGGFTPKRFQTTIVYISPKKRVDGIYNALSHAIPKHYKEQIQNVLEIKITSLNDKKIMCILLGLPVKELNNGKPEFNFRLQEMAKKEIPNLKTLQHDYQQYFTKKIYEVVETLSPISKLF